MTLTPYDLETGERADRTENVPVLGALNYNGLRVADDGKAELVLTGDATELQLSGNPYQDALAISAAYKSGGQQTGSGALRLLRASFRTHVLTPQTAFIVVETKAQEAQLYEMQEQLLSDYGQAAARETLAEPSALVCIIVGAAGIAAILVIKRIRRAKKA